MKKLDWSVKMIMLFVVIMSALLLFKIFIAVPYIRNRDVEKTKIYQEEIAQNIAREMNIGMDRIKNRLSRISMFPEFYNMNIDEMQEIVMQPAKLSERISTIAVLNSEGVIIFGSVKDSSNYASQSYADRSHFTIPFYQGKTCLTPPYYYPEENLFATSICIPIESESGERAGVLIGELDISDIIKRVADYPLAEGQVVCIMDKEGTVVAHSDIDLFALEEGPLSLNYSKWPITQAIINGEKGGSLEYIYEGINYYGTYSVFESNGWGVVVVTSMDSVLAGSKTMIRTILLINLLFFAIAMILTIIVSRKITASQRKADKILQKSEEQHRTLLQNLGEGICIVDKEERFLFANRAAESIFGVRSGELNGCTLKDFVSQDQSLLLDKETRKRGKGEESVYELEITRPDKGSRHILVTATPHLDSKKKITGTFGIFRDTTDIKLAEKEKEKETEKAQKYLDIAQVIMVALNNKGEVTMINRKGCEILGYQEKEIIGKNWFVTCLPAKDREDIIETYNTLISGELEPVEYYKNPIIKKDGEERIIAWHNSILCDDSGKIAGILSSGQDITIQEKTIAALERENYLMNTLMDYAPDHLYFKDIKSKFLRVSNSKALRDGYKDPAELVGKTDHDIFSDNHSGKALLDEQNIIKTGKPLLCIEEKETWKDGKETWVSTSKMPMFDKNGKIVGTFGISKDITERKKAEEALKEREGLLNSITTSAQDGIIMLDNDGNVIFWNGSAEKIFGYKNEEITGKNFHDILVPAEFHEAHRKGFSKFKKTGKGDAIGASLELEALHKNGLKFPVELSLSSINIKGQWHSVGIIRDITQRRVAEEKLEEAVTIAENANRAKSEFLANMSHEIRTPMNAILGFAEILEEQLRDNPRNHDYIKGIRNSGNSLLGLINDILDLSKIEAGKLNISYEPINPFTIIEEIRQIFSVKTNEKKLDFHINIDPKLPRSLIFDETRLRQVLFNLIGNAVKFTNEGVITVNVESEDTNAERSHVNLVVEIIDTGIGIPEKEQQIIFEPFRQKEGQSTRKYGGTGLGLSITQRLVKIMGGTLDVMSTPGQGSTFTVFLPGIQVSALGEINPGQDEEKQNISFQNPLILLVEDIESNRKVIRGYLRNQNITIVEANNGSIGVEKAKEQMPDLILMDMQMPVMDGYEATRVIKSDEKLKKIPVVALTASTMKSEAAEITRLCDGYLRKPVSRSRLLSELKKFLPHTEEKQKIESSADQEGDFFHELRQRLSGDNDIPDDFTRVLNLEINPEYNLLVRNRSNIRIRNFADLMVETGQNLNMEMIEAYGKELHAQVTVFNVQRINSMLNEFAALTKMVKKVKP